MRLAHSIIQKHVGVAVSSSWTYMFMRSVGLKRKRCARSTAHLFSGREEVHAEAAASVEGGARHESPRSPVLQSLQTLTRLLAIYSRQPNGVGGSRNLQRRRWLQAASDRHSRVAHSRSGRCESESADSALLHLVFFQGKTGAAARGTFGNSLGD